MTNHHCGRDSNAVFMSRETALHANVVVGLGKSRRSWAPLSWLESDLTSGVGFFGFLLCMLSLVVVVVVGNETTPLLDKGPTDGSKAMFLVKRHLMISHVAAQHVGRHVALLAMVVVVDSAGGHRASPLTQGFENLGERPNQPVQFIVLLLFQRLDFGSQVRLSFLVQGIVLGIFRGGMDQGRANAPALPVGMDGQLIKLGHRRGAHAVIVLVVLHGKGHHANHVQCIASHASILDTMIGRSPLQRDNVVSQMDFASIIIIIIIVNNIVAVVLLEWIGGKDLLAEVSSLTGRNLLNFIFLRGKFGIVAITLVNLPIGKVRGRRIVQGLELGQ
mmetsp:Transcript_21529/g.59754  ORF Transcript_21529/g.59754 Transcript_21529/m.59754 type:complete len:332 (-) Transcript_21529:465-1460(-)